MHGTFFFRLEDVGADDKLRIQSSNRAELRAVIACLHGVACGNASWEPSKAAKLVVASYSQYVCDGATKWCQDWEANEWKLRNGASVEVLSSHARLFVGNSCADW